jgi:hypothetical protein
MSVGNEALRSPDVWVSWIERQDLAPPTLSSRSWLLDADSLHDGFSSLLWAWVVEVGLLLLCLRKRVLEGVGPGRSASRTPSPPPRHNGRSRTNEKPRYRLLDARDLRPPAVPRPSWCCLPARRGVTSDRQISLGRPRSARMSLAAALCGREFTQIPRCVRSSRSTGDDGSSDPAVVGDDRRRIDSPMEAGAVPGPTCSRRSRSNLRRLNASATQKLPASTCRFRGSPFVLAGDHPRKEGSKRWSG